VSNRLKVAETRDSPARRPMAVAVVTMADIAAFLVVQTRYATSRMQPAQNQSGAGCRTVVPAEMAAGNGLDSGKTMAAYELLKP
jgi:hypothetical protein